MAILGLVAAIALSTAGCGGDGDDGDDGADLLMDDVFVDIERDTQMDVEPPEITLSPADSAWEEPTDPGLCDICQPCGGAGECGEGELCANFEGSQFCTTMCTAGTCPGNSRCWQFTDPVSRRTTSLCLNPTAELGVCPASWACGEQIDPDADVYDSDISECLQGSVCNYCGDPWGAEEHCPETNQSMPCEVLRLVNVERNQVGLGALTYNDALARSAQMHAIEMMVCGYFEHASLDGRDFADRELAAGYDADPGGENIAAGQATAEEVMDGWMNSDGHRANILEPSFTELGVGFYEDKSSDDQYGNRWVQNFGRR